MGVTVRPSALPSPPPSPSVDGGRGGDAGGAAGGGGGEGASPPGWATWGPVTVALAPGTVPFSASTVTDAVGAVSRVTLRTGPRPPPPTLAGGYVPETPPPPAAVELAAELDLLVLQALAASWGGEGLEVADLADAFEDDDEEEEEEEEDCNDDTGLDDGDGGHGGDAGRRGAVVEEGDQGGVLARVRAAVRRLVDLRLVVAERGG